MVGRHEIDLWSSMECSFHKRGSESYKEGIKGYLNLVNHVAMSH
jgi:hypothetical protein